MTIRKYFQTLFISGLLISSVNVFSQMPIQGEIRLFAGNFAPKGWAFCNGQLLPINQNQALFSILGTTYGGNGQTTFALPDLRGRVVAHPDANLFGGQRLGTEANTLVVANLPAHSHSIAVSNAPGAVGSPAEAIPANSGSTDREYSTNGVTNTMNPSTISNTGANQPVNNRQPTLSVSFIIALQGVFPSRD